MKLEELQSLFKKKSLAGEADTEALQHLKPGGKLSLGEAFEVYHNGYIARLSEALGETFEAVWWVLGDALFAETCRKFIETEPSASYNLSDYGQNFPEFLQNYPPAKDLPFIGDLARFEWIFKDIFHAANPDPLPVERIQELTHAEDFKVSFVEAMAVFQSHYSIFELWKRRKEPRYEFEEIEVNRPESLLIHKKEKKTYVTPIDPIEAEVILELQDDITVSQALADYSSMMTPDKTAQLFQMMMRAGIIDDISVV